MWFKALVIINLLLVLISLFGGAFFLTRKKDRQKPDNRVLNALTIRVALSVCLVALLLVGYFTGLISPHEI